MNKFALVAFFSFFLFASTALACEFCYVKNIDCPSAVTPGQEFSISIEFSGTGPDYPYEYISLVRDGTQISCTQLNKQACIWSSHSFTTTAPTTAGTYTYAVRCYAADSLSNSYCGMEDDSSSCTVNVVSASYATTGCTQNYYSCSSPGQCCSGFCCNQGGASSVCWPSSCTPQPTSCSQAGGTCLLYDCSHYTSCSKGSGTCTSGYCCTGACTSILSCSQVGGNCYSNPCNTYTDCRDPTQKGQCTNQYCCVGTCTSQCKTNGKSCSISSECCSGSCCTSGPTTVKWTCSSKKLDGYICNTGDDCCSGNCCILQSGSTTKYCSNNPCNCIPKSCEELGKKCGTWADGCGGQKFCGDCPYGTCNPTTGECECTPSCTGKKCGDADGCGGKCTVQSGCSSGQICVNGECKDSSHGWCSDGTEYGKCSLDKPKYCNNGNLVNNCTQCGCLYGYNCQSDETCKSSSEETGCEKPGDSCCTGNTCKNGLACQNSKCCKTASYTCTAGTDCCSGYCCTTGQGTLCSDTPCGGTVNCELTLNPSTIKPGESVTASLSGCTNVVGAVLYIKKDGCNAASIDSCGVSISGSCSVSLSKNMNIPTSPGTYTYFACSGTDWKAAGVLTVTQTENCNSNCGSNSNNCNCGGTEISAGQYCCGLSGKYSSYSTYDECKKNCEGEQIPPCEKCTEITGTCKCGSRTISRSDYTYTPFCCPNTGSITATGNNQESKNLCLTSCGETPQCTDLNSNYGKCTLIPYSGLPCKCGLSSQATSSNPYCCAGANDGAGFVGDKTKCDNECKSVLSDCDYKSCDGENKNVCVCGDTTNKWGDGTVNYHYCYVDGSGKGFVYDNLNGCNKKKNEGTPETKNCDPNRKGVCDETEYCDPNILKCRDCDPGMRDCNHEGSDGCEVNSMTEKENCGVCGSKCTGTDKCDNGECSSCGNEDHQSCESCVKDDCGWCTSTKTCMRSSYTCSGGNWISSVGGCGWSVRLSASSIKVNVGERVTLTATANKDFTGNSIVFYDSTGVIRDSSGNIISCSSTPCSVSTGGNKRSDTFSAKILDKSGNAIATSLPPITVTWEATTAKASFYPSAITDTLTATTPSDTINILGVKQVSVLTDGAVSNAEATITNDVSFDKCPPLDDAIKYFEITSTIPKENSQGYTISIKFSKDYLDTRNKEFSNVIFKHCEDGEWKDIIVTGSCNICGNDENSVCCNGETNSLSPFAIVIPKGDCPYACCIDEANYTDKACDTGYKCADHECVKLGTGAQADNTVFIIVGIGLGIIILVLAAYLILKRSRGKTPSKNFDQLYEKYKKKQRPKRRR
jgi:hypothetical protein